MTVATNALQHLAVWMHRPHPGATPHGRPSLEDSLLPAVRCAVRTGLGAPALVRWVRGALRDLRPAADPAASAGVERELCHRLADYLRSRPAPGGSGVSPDDRVPAWGAADTVVGP